ncbi:MAG TPA: hypothetical protein VJS89_10175 [Gammaproteobacteria bacterium]|nr:hypothetical protein [Gammaproteobacteria bacterium]
MSYTGGWRPSIESALCLDLRRMFKRGALRASCEASGGWQWTNSDGDQMGGVSYRATLGADNGTLILNYAHGGTQEPKAVTCRIGLETALCHYGGRRWYFRCPYTHRRALKLYKWPGIDLFCHREAIRPRPTYACQRVGGSDRIMAQRWALRRKLGDEYSDLFDEPTKPKWMRWRTFQRYLDRDAELDAREWPYIGRLMDRLDVGTGGLG